MLPDHYVLFVDFELGVDSIEEYDGDIDTVVTLIAESLGGTWQGSGFDMLADPSKTPDPNKHNPSSHDPKDCLECAAVYTLQGRTIEFRFDSKEAAEKVASFCNLLWPVLGVSVVPDNELTEEDEIRVN